MENDLFEGLVAQAQPGFEQVFSALSGQAGVIALSIFIIYSGYKGWWMWGHIHTFIVTGLQATIDELKEDHAKEKETLLQERNEWQTVAMTGLKAAEKAILQAEIGRGDHVTTSAPTQGK